MHKILLPLLFMAEGFLFAQTRSDISLTAGYNKFDDPDFLRDHRMFYGIRAGFYQPDGIGLQLGYEQANGANCQGLNLKRFFANGLYLVPTQSRLKPYGIATLGYEHSNISRHKPSQLFVGAGAGLRTSFTPRIDGFVEMRILRKLKSDDTDIITTVGVGYRFDTHLNLAASQSEAYLQTAPEIAEQEVSVAQPQPTMQQERYPELDLAPHRTVSKKRKPSTHRKQTGNGAWYIQVAALAKSSSRPYLRKLRKKGVRHARTRHSRLHGRKMTFVVVGPFRTRSAAARTLRKVRTIYTDAFIRRF